MKSCLSFHRDACAKNRISYRVHALLGIVLFAGLTAAADAPPTQGIESLSTPPGAGASLLRMTGALIFVLAVFLFGVWFYQNWARTLTRSGKGGKLQIVEGRSLGNRQALYVVGYDRQRWLIGATQAGITLVSALPEAPENVPSTDPAPPAFMSLLQQMLHRKP